MTERSVGPVGAIRYNMFGFFKQCVALYCELANIEPRTLRNVVSPSLDDHQIKPEDFEAEGDVRADPAKIIMNMLYGARLVRFEFL